MQLQELDNSWFERVDAGFDFSDILGDTYADGEFVGHQVYSNCSLLLTFHICWWLQGLFQILIPTSMLKMMIAWCR